MKPTSKLTVTGGDWAVLRYAVASNEGTIDPEFSRHAAYAGPHLLLIADGMQHLSSPCPPSKLAVEEFRWLDVPTDPADLAAKVERPVEDLREIFRKFLAADPNTELTGVLLTAMLWQGTHAAMAHIGSTRAYMLRGGELTQLTRDHTVGQVLVEEGKIRPDELGSDPRFKFLVRYLDGQLGEPADITPHEAAVGDRYVLCTEGISSVMNSRTFRDILRTASDPQDAADQLAGMAFPVEEHGRFTCVVADVVESQP